VFPDDSYSKQLLPHLDQKALFERITADNVMYMILIPANISRCPKLMGAAVPVYACPEDPLQQGINGLALNYLLNKGTGYGGYNDGFKKTMGELKPSDISDGLSNTVAISEKLLSSRKDAFGGNFYEPTADERLRNYAHTDQYPDPSQRNEFLNACSTNVVWRDGGGLQPCTPQGNCLPYLLNLLMPPNSHSCMNGFDSFDWDPGRYAALTATSLHSGGVHTLFADGSVRFVANNVHLPLWQAIGTRSGGEVAF
jgi:prepilin-type processing-associated H-X9-DG protein